MNNTGSMLNSEVAGVINGCWIMGTIQTAEDQSGKWAITNIPKLTNVKVPQTIQILEVLPGQSQGIVET